MSIVFHERPIDHEAALFFCKGAQGAEAERVQTVVSLLSQAVGKGSSCLDLAGLAGQSVRLSAEKELTLPALDVLCRTLASLHSVGVPGEGKPLVLDGAGRLYLYRYWRYEEELARSIMSRAGGERKAPLLDEARLQEGLERLFPLLPAGALDLQRVAASTALHRQFTVISGGPGTGKTSTVVRILALLLEQPGGTGQRIAMAAPTGKAAARLNSSLKSMRESLPCADVILSAIPAEVVTIHRLLGKRPGSARFRHTAANPLPYDTLIVDEASMIDLPLMTALLGALRPASRLILLGDSAQLSSVEAGAVLGDICSAGERNPRSPLSASLVKLEKNYRFSSESGIARLSRAVNAGREREALELLKNAGSEGIDWQQLTGVDELLRLLAPRAVEGFRRYLEAPSPAEALVRFDRFRILCALREGPFGVHGLNSAVETALKRAGLIDTASPWYRGRPVIVTRNDYSLQLFNGDTGIIFPDPQHGGKLRAFFTSPDGALRSLPPERLPLHETAFAMTVHKSQGSEFGELLMVLPLADCEVMTRELIYTAITRAKESVEIWGDEAVFAAAVMKKSERHSGLQEALLQPLLAG